MPALELLGVRTLNLKGFDIKLPYRSLTVITGPAGSGKSALLVHTLWALSRLQLVPAEKHDELRPPLRILPRVESASGVLAGVNLSVVADFLPPAQTLGQFTAVSQALADVIAYHGSPSCGEADCRLVAGHWKAIFAEIEKYLAEKPSRLMLGAHFALKDLEKESIPAMLQANLKRGYRRYRVDKRIFRARGFDAEIPVPKHELTVLFDSFSGEELKLSRIEEAFRHAAEIGSRVVEVLAAPAERSAEEIDSGNVHLARFYLTRGFLCLLCGKSYRRGEEPHDSIANRWHGKPEKDWEHEPLHAILRALYSHDAEARVELLRKKLLVFERLGLGHLRPGQQLSSLSSSERLMLSAAYLELSDLTDTLFLCDEPSRLLHPRELERLREWTGRMTALENTVVVTERDLRWVKADNLIVLGPGAGEKGGEVVYSGPGKEWYVERPAPAARPVAGKPKLAAFKLTFSERSIERGFELPRNAITALVGHGGAGKTLFLRRLAELRGTHEQGALPWQKAELVERRKDKPKQIVAESIGAAEAIAEVFAKLAGAKRAGLKPKDFLSGDDDPRISAVTFHEMTIAQALALSAAEGLSEFASQKEVVARLKPLETFGLSRLRLDSRLEQLGAGERARLRLAAVLKGDFKKETIVLLDQPFTGMSAESIEFCIHRLRHHTSTKGTFVFTSHDPEAIALADYVLELGINAELRFFGPAVEFGLDQFLKLGET